jgi:unsaturated rhamnogalacturonyl hydrolase
MWLDGVYMASPFLAEYAATFGEPELFDDVLRQIENAYEHTHDDRSGLLFHAFDESRAQPWADRETGRSRSFWGRAVGWYAMALADVLDIDRHARRRAKLVAIFRAVADAVARVQDPSGLWWQVLDQGGGGGNYLEESASAMFTYALAKGARQGHLPADHRRLAEKANAAIVERFITTNGDLDVTGCCVGTGLGGTPDRDGSFEYYAARPVATNDHHGVGAFLLASVEIERGTA